MENGYQCSRTGKRAFKYSLSPEDGHVPSKLESKIIRKLCVKSGMTKEEVLSVKENRIFIAEELKKGKGGEKNYYGKRDDRYWKRARKLSGLPNGHPMTKLYYNGISRRGCLFGIGFYPMNPVTFSEKDLTWLKENNVEYLTSGNCSYI